MDITQLFYLITIVNCDFNLSRASKEIHLTQSALSQSISNYEKRENITLFLRKSNRLVALTESGEVIYKYGLEIIKKYEEMTHKASQVASNHKQVIRIGVPSLILMVYFPSMLPKIKENYPEFNFEVVEAGSHQISELLVTDKIDIGIMLGPTELKGHTFHQELVHSSEVMVYIDEAHPLAEEQQLDWTNVLDYDLATFNKEHKIHQLLDQKIKKINNTKEIAYTASAWDYLINLTKKTNIVTFLPELIYQYAFHDSLLCKKIVDPLDFNIYACILKNRHTPEYYAIYKEVVNIF